MNRIFFLIGFSYLIASYLSHYFTEDLWIYILISLIVLTISSCFIKKFRKEKAIPISLFVCSLAVLINIVNFNLNIADIQKLDEKDAVISGKLIDIPYKKNNRYNYILKVQSINNQKIKPFKLKLSSSTTLEAEPYDTFNGKVHFFLPQNDTHFNWKSYYKSNGIYILAYAYNYEPYEITPQKEFSFNHYILKLRKKMLSLPKHIFNDRVGSILNGFLLGEKHNFPDDIKDFSNIGIYHLITTSAIHISILSQFFLWILKKLKVSSKISALITCILIIFFMALTGFTPSVMRAGIISVIYNLGTLFFRKSDSLNSLGIAIILICFINPNATINIGLWLSIFSYLGIILLNPKINDFIYLKIQASKSSKILNYFISLASVSLSVAIFTFPLTALFFKKETLLFVISNFLIIPISTSLLNLTVILQACLLLNLPQFITMPVGAICGVLTNLVVDISYILSRIPFAVISLNYEYVKICLICSLFIIGISLLFKNYKNALKISALISVSFFVVGAIFYNILNYNTTKVAIINCSDGLALVVSEKFKKASIIFYDENFNDVYFKEYFLRTPTYPCDYFNVIYSPNRENLNTLTSNIESNFNDLNLSNITFNQNNPCNLWNHIHIVTKRINNFVFILLNIDETKILISCNGGDISQLPQEYTSCDFFIACKLPLNYKLIKANKIIISANKKNSEIFLNKLFETKKKLFSTVHEGNIYININKNKSIIRRFE